LGKEKNGIVRYLKQIPIVKGTCGETQVLSTEEDFEQGNVSIVMIIGPTLPHFHKKTTEFYFIEKGSGRLVIGEETHEIKNGMIAIIPPNTAHYIIPREVIKVLVFSVPCWRQDDLFELEHKNMAVDYSLFKEKFELIDEILLRAGLYFTENMSREERDSIDLERQKLVLQAGYNKMSFPELRELLKIKNKK
jgi:mannose-6-phosphate isomerase-like protein (cupin superfamily)